MRLGSQGLRLKDLGRRESSRKQKRQLKSWRDGIPRQNCPKTIVRE